MKLYYIHQDQNDGYDTYDSAVVAAESEEAARATHPSTNNGCWNDTYPSWANSPEHVGVRLLGEALPNVSAGVICSSFNAG